MPDRTHYDVLGLNLSASPSAIRAALQRLIRQADELAYHDAAASAALWERIRQIQRDLLAGHARRASYDLALLHAAPPPVPAAEQDELPPPAARVETPVSARRKVHRAAALPAALVAGLVLLLAAASALSLVRHPQTPRPPVALLYSGVPVHSGQAVHLRWSRVSHATRYRIAILSGRAASAREWYRAHVISTRRTAVILPVIGSQLYRYRLAARVGGRWTRWDHAQRFVVLPPLVARPIALRVRGTTHRSALLCWHAVPHAVAYRLRVRGARARRVNGTCAWVPAHPGRHGWRVAALVRGTRTYVGPFAGGQFAIRPRPRRVRRRVEVASTRRRAQPGRTVRPIEVAAKVSPAAPTRMTSRRSETASRRSTTLHWTAPVRTTAASAAVTRSGGGNAAGAHRSGSAGRSKVPAPPAPPPVPTAVSRPATVAVVPVTTTIRSKAALAATGNPVTTTTRYVPVVSSVSGGSVTQSPVTDVPRGRGRHKHRKRP